MFLNGSLEDFSVADILQLLSFSKQTGALHVTGEVKGILYFDDGEAYFATKEGSWPLEDTVVAAGISREDWNAALEIAGQSHAAGQALAERGVAADLIGYVVHHIVSDTTFELMRMSRVAGSFDFRVGEKHAVGPVHKLRVDELVAEVKDRLAEWDAISEFISSPSDLVSAPSELSEDAVELSVSRDQWALLVATIRNDSATVSELARETGRSEAEVASALHPLVSSGLMEVETAVAVPVAPEPVAQETTYSPPAPSVLGQDSGRLAPEVLEEPLDSVDSSPAPDSSDSDYLGEPAGELDEWRFEGESVEQEPVGDSEADPLDTSRPLFESEEAEETVEPDPGTEAAGAQSGDSPVWDLEGANTGFEEEQPADEQVDAPPPSPAETIDLGAGEGESAVRTLALQDLRDLAGTAPVQPATGSRPKNSRKSAETTDDKPTAQPKVRALKRIIAAVRGL